MADDIGKMMGGMMIAIMGIAIISQLVVAAPTGTATFYGKVTDSSNSLPISGALVTINGVSQYTNADGDFSMSGLTPGAYSGTITKEGYHTSYF